MREEGEGGRGGKRDGRGEERGGGRWREGGRGGRGRERGESR
ncbi:unnamed protein product [Spirodela intermedia]|uniref:Uncharacterized protein n=1 Tax=Spirodela intermedia TaxID=51605 RepID=A0A7I8J1W7_SPIIN|nr:unnamed protein product [Spirodela intermedia]CAA6664214.1 unnamed protein product [Spirodela intermedia]